MIFKLLSSFCHLIHVSAYSQLAHQIWWFRMMSDVVGSLVSWESCYFIIFNYKYGQDECFRCFSDALHYHILSRFLNKPCVLLLFYLWRFVCIYIICIKISDWMRRSQIRVLWGIRVVQTFWSANWCLLSAFELFSQICTWRALMCWAVQQFIKINWRSFKTFVTGWILFMGSLVDEPWFGHLLVLMCPSLAWRVSFDLRQDEDLLGFTKTKQTISIDTFSSSLLNKSVNFFDQYFNFKEYLTFCMTLTGSES